MSHKFNFLFFLCFFIVFCSPKEIPKDTLFVMLDSSPNSLDPRRATDANGMRLSDLIFGGLLKFGNQGLLLPDMAYKWDIRGLTYTFYLKPELSFSNGRKVTKEDILFSFGEFQKKSSPFYSAFKNIESVEVFHPVKKEVIESFSKAKESNQAHKESSKSSAEVGFVVKITVKQFQASFLYSDLPVIKILPKKEILESSEDFQKKPIGSGSFELVKKSFHQILLKRREAANSLPEFISFQIIRDSFTRSQKMLSGESDIAPSVIPLDKIPHFERQKENFHVFSSPSFSTTYLLINLKNKNLKQKELREALSLSINRREIIKYKLKSYAIPARSFINPESYFFNKNITEPLFDLQKAKSLIQKLAMEGRELKLSLSNNQASISKAKVLISQMSQSGVKVSFQSSEWGAFYKDVGRGAYEMALMKWVGVRDPDIYRIAFHSENEAPKGRNRSFYKNKKLDQLLDEGFQTRDKAKRKQIYDRIQKRIAEDFIVIPLWHDMEISVLKKNIKNYHLRPNGDFLSLPLIQKQ